MRRFPSPWAHLAWAFIVAGAFLLVLLIPALANRAPVLPGDGLLWKLQSPAPLVLAANDPEGHGNSQQLLDSDLLRAALRNPASADGSLADLRPQQPGLDWEPGTVYQGNPDRRAGRKGERQGREEWVWQVRAYPANQVPLRALADARVAINALGNRLTAQATEHPTWQNVGPAPIEGSYLGNFRMSASGRSTALVVDPRNPDVAYAGTSLGGAWKTTDGGANWRPLTDHQPSLAVGSLALDPSDPDTVYVGTGEPNGSDSFYGAGLLKSTDGGLSWTQLGQGMLTGLAIADIAVHPTDRRTIYIATTTLNLLLVSPVPNQVFPGVYKSTDGGVTWDLRLACAPANCTGVHSLELDPRNPEILYSGVEGWGVYKTTDAGATWARKTQGWPGDAFSRVEVALSPSDSSILYAGVSYQTGGGRVGLMFKSADAAENWTFLNSLQTFTQGQGYCGSQCDYNNVVSIHPTNPDIVMNGGQAFYSPGKPGIDGVIFRSLDGGATWDTNSGESPATTMHPDLHAIEFAPTNPDVIWAGNDGGVYRSLDGGATWETRNEGLATLAFNSVALHPTNTDIFYGGMQDNAKSKTENGGGHWEGVDAGDAGFAAIDSFDPRYWYGTRFSRQGLYMQFQRNSNYGSSAPDDWPVLDQGININNRVAFYAPLHVDPNVEGRVYWGTDRLYRSDNRGNDWSAISADLTKDLGGASYLSNFVVSPQDSNAILVGTSDGYVQLTQNGGQSWRNVTRPPLPNRYVTDLAFDPRDSQTLYAVYGGFDRNTPTTPGHAFKSTDAGRSWVNISAGLPDLPAWSIVADPAAPQSVYVATDLGVFRSADGGASWFPFGRDLPDIAVFELALDADNGLLYAASHGRSIWRVALGADRGINLYLPFLARGGSSGATPTATPSPTSSATPTPTYTPVPSSTPAPSETPGTPTVTATPPPPTATPAGSISGRVTEGGAPAATIPLQLCAWAGSTRFCDVIATTTTGADGTYTFRGVPAMPAGIAYYVEFTNTTGQSDRLAWWRGPDIGDYTATTNRDGGDFDIANVVLDQPAAGISATLPVTFTWQARGVSGDSYRVGLIGPDQTETLFAPVGAQEAFTLSRLADPLRYRVDYGWFVQIETAAGSGRSYAGGPTPAYRLIRFEPGEETEPLPSPTSLVPD